MADETEPTTSADAPGDDTSDVAAAVVTDGAYALVVADFGVKISHRPFCGLQDAVAHWVSEDEQLTP